MPPAKRYGWQVFTGCLLFGLHCRGRMHAARKISRYFALFGNDRVPPTLQTGANGRGPANPARRAPLPGRIYAAPTNHPATAGKRV